MKICHVGLGVTRIPPRGWGAVESLIWDYKIWVERLGHEFYIINTPRPEEVVRQVASCQPDVVHVHCERYFNLLSSLDVKVKIACSHGPSIYESGQKQMILQAIQLMPADTHICCLTDGIRQFLVEIGVLPSQLFVSRNGANPDLYRVTETPLYPDRSIFLAAVCERKRQYLIQDFDFVDFIGPIQDTSFDFSTSNYLGEWPKGKVYSSLTDYASLVLLSSSEVAPLVTCEALMAGLGLVVSERAAVNLDFKRPFIDVIPEERINDKTYIEGVIKRNQDTAVKMRREIRQYAESHFSWKTIVEEYINSIQQFSKG